MLPPRKTLCPASSKILAVRVVVVVFPSLPVIAIIFDGQSKRNASISLVSTAPLFTASAISGTSYLMPGDLKIMS